MEKSQPLRRNLLGEKTDPGGVAARPGKARDQTKRDGVSADAEDNRDCCGRHFGRLSSSGRAGRSDNGDATADEVSHERRQSIDLIFAPAVYDRDVLALDIAAILEATVKSAKTVRVRVRRLAVEKPDHRHRRLLRARRERPRRRAAERG